MIFGLIFIIGGLFKQLTQKKSQQLNLGFWFDIVYYFYDKSDINMNKTRSEQNKEIINVGKSVIPFYNLSWHACLILYSKMQWPNFREECSFFYLLTIMLTNLEMKEKQLRRRNFDNLFVPQCGGYKFHYSLDAISSYQSVLG